MNRRQMLFRCLTSLAVCAMLDVPQAAVAQASGAYPSRPITLVVPYPPGGAADQFARSLGHALGERLGQSVVVENRPGANGNIGSAYVARRQAADGYTLLLGSASTLTINPNLYADIGYDPVKDLQPITLTHQMPNVLVVSSKTPYKRVADVVRAAKANPGHIAFGSAGYGNTMHLAGVLFQRQAGIKLVHVPYKGGAPALMDVLAGTIPMMFNNLPALVPLKDSDKVRLLAVADTKRSPVLPKVPTFAEEGLPGVVSVVWNGILVRRGTPQAIVDRLNWEMGSILKSPAFRQPLEAQGYEVLSSTPGEFEALIKKDLANMHKLTKEAGMKIN
ncbi:Bug family tripartite tricarboxylate transporter substrate binding protein [Candidimonas nitroreducens]|nr:tripartite tricarboxylate transporter substrate binding protein [Candidimonas nitroreducens]